jgi:hypothetical protein
MFAGVGDEMRNKSVFPQRRREGEEKGFGWY